MGSRWGAWKGLALFALSLAFVILFLYFIIYNQRYEKLEDFNKKKNQTTLIIRQRSHRIEESVTAL